MLLSFALKKRDVGAGHKAQRLRALAEPSLQPSSWFLIPPRTACPGLAPPPSGRGLPHQSSVIADFPTGGLMEASSQSRFLLPQMTLACVELTKLTNQYHSQHPQPQKIDLYKGRRVTKNQPPKTSHWPSRYNLNTKPHNDNLYNKYTWVNTDIIKRIHGWVR